MAVIGRLSIEQATQEITDNFKKLNNKILDILVKSIARREALPEKYVMGKIIEAIKLMEKKTYPLIEKHLTWHYEKSNLLVTSAMVKAGIDTAEKLSQDQILQLNAIVSETLNDYGDALRGTLNSSQKVMTLARKERIQILFIDGNLGEKGYQEIKKRIVEDLSKDLTSIVDRGGRTWRLDTYAEMLTRTRLREITNTSLQKRLQIEKFDLVQVSIHNSDHEECRRWEGKILSITGNTPGYPTTRDAENAGLMHPNCKHRYLPAPLELRLKKELLK
jgi:hypothetical protein